MMKKIYAVLACLALLCVLGWTQGQSRVMWEYKVVQVTADPPEGYLNTLGADGWELIPMRGAQDLGGRTTFYFKRARR